MQHVLALRGLPIRDTRRAGQLDLDAVEHGPERGLVFHFEQTRVEVEFRGERADSKQTSTSD